MTMRNLYALFGTLLIATSNDAADIQAELDIAGDNELFQMIFKKMEMLGNRNTNGTSISKSHTELASALLQVAPVITIKGNITDPGRRYTISFTVQASQSSDLLDRLKLACNSLSMEVTVLQSASFKRTNVSCVRKQFPHKVAYALTIHKAQGITVDQAVVDIGSSEYSLGLSYVGLSRVKTFEGLLLDPPFSLDRLMSINRHGSWAKKKEALDRLNEMSNTHV